MARSTWPLTNQVSSDDSGNYARARLQSVSSKITTHCTFLPQAPPPKRRGSLSRCVAAHVHLREEERGGKKERKKKSVISSSTGAAVVSDLRGLPLGHRRLMARAAVRMTPSTIRKGSQVFRNPAQLESGKGGRVMFL